MDIDSRYIPTVPAGYVWFSNFKDALSEQEVLECTLSHFDIPKEAVLIGEFTPEGTDEPTKFSAIAHEFAPEVNRFHEQTTALLKVLSMIFDPTRRKFDDR